MTGIHINKDPERLSVSVTAKGHAGIAPRGEDIICAAISTLIYGYGAEIATLDDRSIRERVVDMGKENGCGIYALVKTSNPSGAQLQDLDAADGRKIYEVMADFVSEWGADTIGECG